MATDLSQSALRKINNLCDLSGLCEITRICLQLSLFLTAEIRANPGNVIADATPTVGLRHRQLDA